MGEESWEAELEVAVEDLGGGRRTLRVACRLRSAAPREAAEARAASAIEGVVGFAISKYAMSPEHFLGREETLQKEIRAAFDRATDDRPTPGCEVLRIELVGE